MIAVYLHNPTTVKVEPSRHNFCSLTFRDRNFNNFNTFFTEAEWNSFVETIRIADKALNSEKEAA